MKLEELFEELSLDDDISDILMDFFITLKIHGITEIPVSSAVAEIEERYGIEIDFELLRAFVDQNELVQNMNEETIFLDEPENLPVDNSSEDTVSDLADKAQDFNIKNSSEKKVADMAMKAVQ